LDLTPVINVMVKSVTLLEQFSLACCCSLLVEEGSKAPSVMQPISKMQSKIEKEH
jgi:hypothetical protein